MKVTIPEMSTALQYLSCAAKDRNHKDTVVAIMLAWRLGKQTVFGSERHMHRGPADYGFGLHCLDQLLLNRLLFIGVSHAGSCIEEAT